LHHHLGHAVRPPGALRLRVSRVRGVLSSSTQSRRFGHSVKNRSFWTFFSCSPEKIFISCRPRLQVWGLVGRKARVMRARSRIRSVCRWFFPSVLVISVGWGLVGDRRVAANEQDPFVFASQIPTLGALLAD